MVAITGDFVSLVTPFTDDNSTVSEIRLIRVIRYWAEQGAAGFAVATDAGEFQTISGSERKQVLEILLREVGGRPVLVNVTRLGTSMALDLAQHASRHGARAVIAMPPYYGKFRDQEIIEHFRTLAKFAGVPVLAVDPLSQITPAARDVLASVPELAFAISAGPNLGCSACKTDHMRVSLGVAANADALDALGKNHDPAALMKTFHELKGIDAGRPRSPRFPLTSEGDDELAAVLRA